MAKWEWTWEYGFLRNAKIQFHAENFKKKDNFIQGILQ